MREMQVFWRKNEKEERDVRKREQKEAIDRAKIEEEKREAARQARKLEFLISQTELYSHFVGNKLKSTCPIRWRSECHADLCYQLRNWKENPSKRPQRVHMSRTLTHNTCKISISTMVRSFQQRC